MSEASDDSNGELVGQCAFCATALYENDFTGQQYAKWMTAHSSWRPIFGTGTVAVCTTGGDCTKAHKKLPARYQKWNDFGCRTYSMFTQAIINEAPRGLTVEGLQVCWPWKPQEGWISPLHPSISPAKSAVIIAADIDGVRPVEPEEEPADWSHLPTCQALRLEDQEGKMVFQVDPPAGCGPGAMYKTYIDTISKTLVLKVAPQYEPGMHVRLRLPKNTEPASQISCA